MNIGLLIFPEMMQLDFTAPHEVFSLLPGCRVQVVAQTLDPVRASSGLGFLPQVTFADAPQFDLLCVPGGKGVDAQLENEEVLEFLRDQAQDARYLTSVCTGALLLGAAGLLKGYRATTHWQSLGLLPLFGATPVAERVVIDRGRITGGGVTAGIDFALTVAAQLFGEKCAKVIQLHLEYNPEPPFACGHPTTADPAIVEMLRSSRATQRDVRRRLAEIAARRYCR